MFREGEICRESIEYLLAYICCEYMKFMFLVGVSTPDTGSAWRSSPNAPLGAWYGTTPFHISVLALKTPQSRNLNHGLSLRLLHIVNMNHIPGGFPNEELEQESNASVASPKCACA